MVFECFVLGQNYGAPSWVKIVEPPPSIDYEVLHLCSVDLFFEAKQIENIQ